MQMRNKVDGNSSWHHTGIACDLDLSLFVRSSALSLAFMLFMASGAGPQVHLFAVDGVVQDACAWEHASAG